MSRINKPAAVAERTHEGAPAAPINAEKQLRRSLMACMLWEGNFYESGEEIASRMAKLVKSVGVDRVFAMAVEARNLQKLRHAPLWIARAMAGLATHRSRVAELLEVVIQRADELSEFVALYWKEGKRPLSAQIKKGLARAFPKFDQYQLSKYNRDTTIKLRDVLFLCHAKPKNKMQGKVWKKLIDGKLPAPDTWEVALSAGKDKKKTWERLIKQNMLGALAFLRNLRNMQEAGVDEKVVFAGLKRMRTERVLPFRFISAARFAPQWEPQLEDVMFKCLEGRKPLPGKTILLVDVSGSMNSPISSKTEVRGMDVAAGLAVLARELCQRVEIHTFSDRTVAVPLRRGFALRDAIIRSQQHGGTQLGKAVRDVGDVKADRLIVLTDEQSHDPVGNAGQKLSYMINVSSTKNGVGYGAWTHIDGWSEAILDYIAASEEEAN